MTVTAIAEAGIPQSGIQKAKSRTAENTSLVSETQQRAIRALADEIHRLNHAVIKAVEAGVSVELIRSSRHHQSTGENKSVWGDLMVPVINAS